MGIAALVLGILSIIIGFIPLCGTIAFFPAIVGIILGIIEIVTKSKKNEKKGMGIAGVILSALAIVFIVFWVLIIGTSDTGNIENNGIQNDINNSITNNNSSTSNKPNKVEVTIPDFSQMSKEEIQSWCDTNKIKCDMTEKYSDSVDKGSFIEQSIVANKIVYEGDKVTITYSLGKEPSQEYKNALRKAESYAKNMHMSKQRIYDQLTSEYGENFPADAAQYAIDNLVADWNANALAKAKSYQSNMAMSKQRIYNQLISEYGERFTAEEAQYAIDHLDE